MSGPESERLPTGTVSRDRAGFRWWRYERPEPIGSEPLSRDERRSGSSSVDPITEPSAAVRPGPERIPTAADGPVNPTHSPQPVAPMVIGAVLIAAVALACGQLLDNGAVVRVLVGAFGVIAAVGLARHVQARHPEEPWIGTFIIWGMIVKIVGTISRYYVFVVASDRKPDAFLYDRYGREYLDGTARALPDLRKTNFIYYLTRNVYTLLGPDLIAAFLVFGIAAFVGAYLWYRATAEAVPSLNRKLYCGLLFFAPSLAFWPSSVGKEALMLLALGLVAFGASRIFGGRLLRGFAIAAPGAWLLWVVRPHLLAFATVAAGGAYLVGRGSSAKVTSASLKRPIGLIALGLLGVLAVTQATEFLGMESLSISSVEQELGDTSAQTSQGGSSFDTGTDSESGQVHLTPLSVPQGLVTVLLRPFPWEIESGSQLVACLECAVFAYLVVVRRRSIVASIRQSRSSPFLFFCWIMLAFFAVAYSSFGNMGLLVRQRSLMLPVFFALISVEPLVRDNLRTRERDDVPDADENRAVDGGGLLRS